MAEVMKNEEEIGKVRNANPDLDNVEIDNSNFALQKRSISSLEVLNDTEFDTEDWLSQSADSTWVIRTLKLWFTLHKDHNEEEWTQFPEILQDAEFFEKVQPILLKIGPEFGKICVNCYSYSR